MAAVDFSAGASAGSQYDTNARQLAGIESVPPAPNGNTSRDDVSTFVAANVRAQFGGKGPLNGDLGVSYSHSESQRVDTLNHDDYTISGSLNWRPSQVFDIALRASQNRLPLGLADIGGATNSPQTTRSTQGVLHVRPTPRWQIGLTPASTETRTRLPGVENFRLIDNSLTASLEFLGAGLLVPGISGSESKSRYSGIANPTRYNQKSANATLSYQLTKVTNLGFAAGKTWRETKLRAPSTDPAALAIQGKDSAFTGSLDIRRQLTAKTGVTFRVFRNFQQYNVGVNTSIGTGFSTGVNWAATRKFSANLNLSHTWSTIDDLEIGGVILPRKDLVRTYSVGMNYLATRLVSVNASVTRNIRQSIVWDDQYNGTIANIGLAIKFD